MVREVVQVFLQDKRTDPSVNDNYESGFTALQALLADTRVNPVIYPSDLVKTGLYREDIETMNDHDFFNFDDKFDEFLEEWMQELHTGLF